MPSLIPFSVFFFCLFRAKFLTYIIFLLSKELLLTFLMKQFYWQEIPSVLFVWENLYFFFTLNGYIWRVQTLSWWVFSLNALNISLCSLFCFYGFCELDVITFFFFLYMYGVFFSLTSFRILSLSLIFCNLKIICL